MKKLLFVLAIGAFAACGTGTSTDAVTDSTMTNVDSLANAAKDSISATVDTAVKKVDSTVKAATDSVKAKM
ncbi:MAG: hypothetical protein JSS67_00740 [Bacteroidetes bacterium]|mgnify:CR=1 FL=1|nr:hypothetical protein [Bacteroidota bacterium]